MKIHMLHIFLPCSGLNEHKIWLLRVRVLSINNCFYGDFDHLLIDHNPYCIGMGINAKLSLTPSRILSRFKLRSTTNPNLCGKGWDTKRKPITNVHSPRNAKIRRTYLIVRSCKHTLQSSVYDDATGKKL